VTSGGRARHTISSRCRPAPSPVGDGVERAVVCPVNVFQATRLAALSALAVARISTYINARRAIPGIVAHNLHPGAGAEVKNPSNWPMRCAFIRSLFVLAQHPANALLQLARAAGAGSLSWMSEAQHKQGRAGRNRCGLHLVLARRGNAD